MFRGLMVNEFRGQNFVCGKGCRCMFDTPLQEYCMVAGTGVLEQ